MKVVISTKLRKLGIVLWFVFAMPAVGILLWYVISEILPVLPDTVLIGIPMVGIGLYVSTVLLKQVAPTLDLEAKQASFQDSQEQLTKLYDHSPVPYVTINRSGKAVMANLAAVRLFESTVDNILGQDILSKITTENEDDLSVALGKLESGVPVTDVEVMITTANGKLRWVLLSVFVQRVASEERLMTLVDITQRKTVDQAKSEFVALASHQLRTPIAAIRWNVELLKGSDLATLTGKQQNYFVKIERNVTRMISLINDFLSVSKLETGTYAAALETFTLDTYLQEILDEQNQAITEKGLQVQQSFVPANLSITADARLLHIVTSNLISNATKYTPSDGALRISYTVDNDHVVCTFSDSGIGIPQSEVEKLFTKFFRASNARLHKAQGTGLGLYIVKQAVEQMGGGITVQSEEGKGSLFTIRVPLTRT